MVRPTQPLGTFGKITVKRTRTGHVATTRFRELNGSYRRVTANGETAMSAENRLKEKIAAGLPSQAEGDLKPGDAHLGLNGGLVADGLDLAGSPHPAYEHVQVVEPKGAV